MSYESGQPKRREDGQTVREPERGEGLTPTHERGSADGVRPLDNRYFIPRDVFVELFAGIPAMDYGEFRAEIDAYVDSDPTPRHWPEP
jgi:hypothetical protein